MIALLAALTLGQALDKMRDIETSMTDCSLGVAYECERLTTDEYEQDLNDLVIFQGQFQPADDAQLDEWEEALRNLKNAAEDADRELRRE